jgi:hypothetical protein
MKRTFQYLQNSDNIAFVLPMLTSIKVAENCEFWLQGLDWYVKGGSREP